MFILVKSRTLCVMSQLEIRNKIFVGVAFIFLRNVSKLTVCWILAFVLQRTVKFFKTSTTREELTVYEKFKFINLWFVLILINDILFVVGSIFKILLEKKVSTNWYCVCLLFLVSLAEYLWRRHYDLWRAANSDQQL